MNTKLEYLLGAEGKIAFDKFHIAKYLTDAVYKVRRQEHRWLMQQGVEGYQVWLAAQSMNTQRNDQTKIAKNSKISASYFSFKPIAGKFIVAQAP